MAQVFLSYARPNAKKAAQVAAALRDQGYSVWFDESLPVASAVAGLTSYLTDNPSAALRVANALSALGAIAETFAILAGYCFNDGRWRAVAPLAGDLDRITAPLFLPPMRAVWRTAQFGQLLQRIGLEDYWRQSNTVPDFRRG